MAEGSLIVKRASGLFTHPNKFHAVPNGALSQARNCAIDREGILSKRRGIANYSSSFTTNPKRSIFEFNERLVVHAGTSMHYDNGSGTFASWTGTFSAPDASIRMRAIESNNNFYFTTSSGVYKNDTLAGTPVRAGMPQGLDTEAATTGASGWLANGSSVGYRIVWGREDANGNLILGAPSFQEIITNSSGGTRNIVLTITRPDGLQTGDFFEVYRTFAVTAVASLSDRHFFLKRVTPSSVTARGTETFTDIYSEDFIEDTRPLYTNDLSETISQSNDRPPFCRFAALFKGHAFYGHISREQEKEIRVTDTASFTSGVSTVKVNLSGTDYTFTAHSTTENIGAQQFRYFSSGVLATDVRDTAKSIVRVINRNSLPFVAHYNFSLTGSPGRIILRWVTQNTATPSVYANSTATGSNFEPALPTTAGSLNFSANAKSNHLGRSKFQRPEAVPYLNQMEIGRQNKEILGLAALKDALLVFKEDGVYTVTGETDGAGGFNFVVTELDPTIRVLAPESLATLDNAVFAYTTQGVIKISEGGSVIVSRAIEQSLSEISQFSSFSTITHAVSYESDRKYILFTQETASDTTCKVAWVYNYLTNTWCQWEIEGRCAYVLSSDQRLYIGMEGAKELRRERKSFLQSNEDYMDESYTVVVTTTGTTVVNGVTKTTVTFDASAIGVDFGIGWLFEQGSVEGKVTATTGSLSSITCTLSTNVTVTATSATVTRPIDMFVEYAPEIAGNAGAMKQFSSCQIYMEEDFALTNKIGFFADTQSEREFVSDVAISRSRGWGTSPWGPSPWGDGQEGRSTPIRTIVPKNHQRCRALRVFYRHMVAKEAVNIVQTTLAYRMFGGERAERQPT